VYAGISRTLIGSIPPRIRDVNRRTVDGVDSPVSLLFDRVTDSSVRLLAAGLALMPWMPPLEVT
jgi:hypothetical protein